MILTQEYRAHWSISSKIVFRILFCYLSLYILFLFTGTLFERPFIWIGKVILGIDYTFEANGYGSGDNTYAYVLQFINLVLAFAAVLVWSIVDKNRKSYNQVLYWFLIVLRLLLICAMFLYGFVKVFQIQFPAPSLLRLLEPLGNFSPMGLAWTYMGYSKGFGMFAGFMEILGGLLLIPRRTQTLGSLLVIGVMLQVAVMNFMFDIPVKLFSVHLIFMAAVIFMTDSKRFTQVFIKNEATKAYIYYNPVIDKSYSKSIFWVKVIGLCIMITMGIVLGSATEKSSEDENNRPYFYGIWEATRVIKNKDTVPALIYDKERWRYLIIDKKNSAIVKYMDDSKGYFKFKTDTLNKRISMYPLNEDSLSKNIRYSYPTYSALELTGILGKDSINILLKRKNLDGFLLHSRGFHWINESPLNK